MRRAPIKSAALPFYLKAVQASTHQAPQAGSQNTYDGMIIWALAADLAKSHLRGPVVNADIPKVTSPGGTLVYSYAQGLKDIKAGKRITYIGASGPFDFNKYHNVFGPFDAVVATPSGELQDRLHADTCPGAQGSQLGQGRHRQALCPAMPAGARQRPVTVCEGNSSLW